MNTECLKWETLTKTPSAPLAWEPSKDTTVHEQAQFTWSIDIFGAQIWYMQPKRKHLVSQIYF